MIINTNRVLLETFTNTTIDNPKKSDSVVELISILFMVAMIACYCCCLSYKKEKEKSFSISENGNQNCNLEIQERREINFQREKDDVIEV